MTAGIAIWDSNPAVLGEGIIFDQRHDKLFWVDIKRAKLFEADPARPGSEEWTIEGDVGPTFGCIAVDPVSDGFLAATARGLIRLRCDFANRVASVEPLLHPEEDLPGNRFNDGGVDPFGAFWAGTMHDAESETTGSWWRWDGEHANRIATDFHVTNGPAFLAGNDRQFSIFLTDSAVCTVYKAKYSCAAGIGQLQIWAQFDPSDGYPDGMCIDGSGRLWIAFWDGAAIRAFDPRQRKASSPVARVDLPVRRPTKLAFASNGDCFVTSASIGLEGKAPNGAVVRIPAAMITAD